jgi:hypothetical protein
MFIQEKFEDTKSTIRSYQLKVQKIHWPKEKGQLEAGQCIVCTFN